MSEKPPKEPYLFFVFWGIAIGKAWKNSREKFGLAVDITLALSAIVLFCLTWYSKHNPKFDADKEGAFMSYWFALIPVGLWILWFGWHVPKAPHEIYKEVYDKYQIEVERNKPKFRLSCSRDIIGCHVPSLNGQWSIRRVQVVADCETAIKNCRGHLIKVEKDGVVVFGHDTLVLPFAKSEAEDSLAKTLHPHIPEYLDVLCWSNPPHIVNFSTKNAVPALDHKRNYIFENEGIYILTVSVTGDGPPPGTIKLKLTWKNPFPEAVMEEIQEAKSTDNGNGNGNGSVPSIVV
jgi:hypothetical protein